MARKRGAAAVVIGDEILTGKIRDENGPHLVETLRSIGLPLGRILTVADDVDEIAWAVSSCVGAFSPIFTSGGIGPTHDDLTVQGVAQALGRGVVHDPTLEELIRSRHGADMPEEALRLARMPEGAALLRSQETWYPLICVDEIYLLPGIPQLFRMHLGGLLERYRGDPFHLRCVYLSVGEAPIAAALDRIAAAYPQVALGSYPRLGESPYRVKLTLEAQREAPVEEALEALLALLPAGSVLGLE